MKKGDELFSNYGPHYSSLLKPSSNSKTSWYYDCWQKFKRDHPEETKYIEEWEEMSHEFWKNFEKSPIFD